LAFIRIYTNKAIEVIPRISFITPLPPATPSVTTFALRFSVGFTAPSFTPAQHAEYRRLHAAYRHALRRPLTPNNSRCLLRRFSVYQSAARAMPTPLRTAQRHFPATPPSRIRRTDHYFHCPSPPTPMFNQRHYAFTPVSEMPP
jgi:hypothetical protein